MKNTIILILCLQFIACNFGFENVSFEESERRDRLSSLNCCECLAFQSQEVPHPDLACPQLNFSVEASSELFNETPCLCDKLEATVKERRDFCQEQLLQGLEIQVVGRCLESQGACADACNQQVFVFPLESL